MPWLPCVGARPRPRHSESMLDPQARRRLMQQAMSPGQDSQISSIPAPPHQVSMWQCCSTLSAVQESTASSTNACPAVMQWVGGTHPPPTSPATGTPAARQVSSTMSSRRRIPSSLRARRPRASSAWTSTPAAVRATGGLPQQVNSRRLRSVRPEARSRPLWCILHRQMPTHTQCAWTSAHGSKRQVAPGGQRGSRCLSCQP